MVNENWLAFSHFVLFCTYHSFCLTLYVATEAYGFEDDYVLINVSSMDFLITKKSL